MRRIESTSTIKRSIFSLKTEIEIFKVRKFKCHCIELANMRYTLSILMNSLLRCTVNYIQLLNFVK